MDSIWCVNHNHKILLFKEREDAEKYKFNVEYKYFKKRLVQEKKLIESDPFRDYQIKERKEFSLKLNERTEKYIDDIYNSDCTWQEKNKKLYEDGILWEDNEKAEKTYVEIGSVICCNNAPYIDLECLPVH